MDEHQGSAPCTPVWKTGVYLLTLMLGEPDGRQDESQGKLFDSILPEINVRRFGDQFEIKD